MKHTYTATCPIHGVVTITQANAPKRCRKRIHNGLGYVECKTPLTKVKKQEATMHKAEESINSLSVQDRITIFHIVERYNQCLVRLARQPLNDDQEATVQISLAVCHVNAVKLRLDDMLTCGPRDLIHDVEGIDLNMCRDTATLKNHFLPRMHA